MIFLLYEIHFPRSWKWLQSLQILKYCTFLPISGQCSLFKPPRKHRKTMYISWGQVSSNKDLLQTLWSKLTIMVSMLKYSLILTGKKQKQNKKVFTTESTSNPHTILQEAWFWNIGHFQLDHPSFCLLQDNFPRKKNASKYSVNIFSFRKKKCEMSNSWSKKVFHGANGIILAKCKDLVFRIFIFRKIQISKVNIFHYPSSETGDRAKIDWKQTLKIKWINILKEKKKSVT